MCFVVIDCFYVIISWQITKIKLLKCMQFNWYYEVWIMELSFPRILLLPGAKVHVWERKFQLAWRICSLHKSYCYIISFSWYFFMTYASCGVYPLRSFYYQGPKWMSISVLVLVRSLSTSVLSTDLDIHFGPLSLGSFASSVLFTDLTWKTKMQPAGCCSWTILFFETCHVMIK